MDQKLVAGAARRPAWAVFCALALLAPLPAMAGVGENPDVEAIYQFTLAPSGLTIAPDGSWVMGVNQAERPRLRSVRIDRAGEVQPFPNEKISLGDPSANPPLDAVEALQCDSTGIIWMLDNGRRSEVPPKIIAWDAEHQSVARLRYLQPPAVVPGSFVADLLIDPTSPLIIISDPAAGANAALILLDRETGIARRVLQGHASLQPDRTVTLTSTRTGQDTRRLDGSSAMPHTGVRPLATDRKGQWLYYTPVQSRAVYRLPMALLRNPDTPPEKLAQAVENYATTPACSSLALDNKGNLYIADVQNRSIGVVDPDKRQYRALVSDSRLIWPDGLCFGQDGKLYFFSRSQAVVGTGRDGRSLSSAHSMFRIRPLAAGQPGS